jgi:hypothetical protein
LIPEPRFLHVCADPNRANFLNHAGIISRAQRTCGRCVAGFRGSLKQQPSDDEIAYLDELFALLHEELDLVGIKSPNGRNGLIVVGPTSSVETHRDLIITLAARHRLPAVYSSRLWTTAGGLISYSTNSLDQYRRAAGYVDRILRGEKPADLPVQAPTKFELVINLKTAKALGLDIPPIMLARADVVIE